MVFISFSLITVEAEYVFITGHLDFKSFAPSYYQLSFSYWFVGVLYVLDMSPCQFSLLLLCNKLLHDVVVWNSSVCLFLFLLMLLRVRHFRRFWLGNSLLAPLMQSLSAIWRLDWIGWLAGDAGCCLEAQLGLSTREPIPGLSSMAISGFLSWLPQKEPPRRTGRTWFQSSHSLLGWHTLQLSDGERQGHTAEDIVETIFEKLLDCNVLLIPPALRVLLFILLLVSFGGKGTEDLSFNIEPLWIIFFMVGAVCILQINLYLDIMKFFLLFTN